MKHQDCPECSRAYQLLELPYGAPLDEVKKAQRELAKSLHPDSWGQKRGAHLAQEQLKQINAGCNHVAACRMSIRTIPSRNVGYKGNGDETRNQDRSPANAEYVLIPKLDESIFDAVITVWLKQVGDEVVKGEPLFEISTDKIDAEIPSPADGVLSEIIVPAGIRVPMQTIVCVITRNGPVQTEEVQSQQDDRHGQTPPFPGKKRSPFQAANQEHATRADQTRSWRITKVFLRAVWRSSKIFLVACFAGIATALVLLGIFMALWEYWEGEVEREKGRFDSGLLNGRLFSFLESITWVPRHIWGGIMSVATILLFGIIFAGQSMWQIASSNWLPFTIVGCLIAVGVLTWSVGREWNAEFSLALERARVASSSWVMGMIVLIACPGALAWWTLARPLPSSQQDTVAIVAPEGRAVEAQSPQVVSEPSAPVSGSQDHQLLWDYTSNMQIQNLSDDTKQRLRDVVGPITGHQDEMFFGPAVSGTFYPGQNPGSQTAYSVTLPWTAFEGRSHSDGDLSFLVIATGDHLDLYRGSYAGTILGTVRAPNADTDLVVNQVEWSGQGQVMEGLRAVSVAEHSLKLMADAGTSSYNDCADGNPRGIVADRVYFRGEKDGSITILPREHFLLPCGASGRAEALGVNSDDAEKVFLRLPNLATQDGPTGGGGQVQQGLASKDSESADVQSALSGWANAIKANDLVTELGYYSDTLDRYFLRRTVTKEFVAQDKQRFYTAGKHFIDYYVDQVVVDQSSPEAITVSLVKHWQVSDGSGIGTGEARSRLWLTRERGDWKIIGEQDLK